MKPNLSDDILALLCIVVVSLFGLISNGLSLHITTTNSHFRNAYGTLCTIVLLCNIQTISIILIWGAVVLTTNYRELSSPKSSFALIPGCLANASLYGAVLVNLLIAINRYCAFAYPLKYHCYWSITKARKAGIAAYFLGFLPCFPNFVEPCTLIFNMEFDFRWSYCKTSCGYINSLFDTMMTTSTLFIAACIDFVTLIKIRNRSKLRRMKQGPLNSNSTNRRNDIIFFKQSFVGGLIMILSAIIFNIGQHFLINKWALFVVSTIAWQLAHVLDGFVVLIFNWHHIYNLRRNENFFHKRRKANGKSLNVSLGILSGSNI